MANLPNSQGPPHSAQAFSQFIRRCKAEIVADWSRAVTSIGKARGLTRPALIDHIPSLLESIAQGADELASGRARETPEADAATHAHHRMGEGFDLPQVVAEYALLRRCVLDRWANVRVAAQEGVDLVHLNEAIDRAIEVAVERYTDARDRTVRALDHVAAVALDTTDIDQFLRDLLAVFVRTTAAVDTAAVYLREGDVLECRAAVGLDLDAAPARRVGEGFEGDIALNGVPIALQTAPESSGDHGQELRRRGLLALHGACAGPS